MPWKSGISTSMRHAGTRSRVSRIVSAKIDAPPSARSSRSTDVIDREREPHARHGLGHARRLRGVELGGPSMRHRAVGARPRAHVAEDHERRRAVVPALPDVGAAGVLAHGVQLQLLHDALQPDEVGRAGRAHLQPFRLRLARAQELDGGFDGHRISSVPGSKAQRARGPDRRLGDCGPVQSRRCPGSRSPGMATPPSSIRTPGGVRVLFDPWFSGNPACPPALKKPPRADLILVSHGHADHVERRRSARRATRARRSWPASSCATGWAARGCSVWSR